MNNFILGKPLVVEFLHASQSKPRVAVYSLRHTEDHVSRACGYTFEDVIARDLDQTDIIAPDFGTAQSLTRRANVWAARKFGSGFGVVRNQTVLDRDYELFFFSVAQPRDLLYLNSLKNWRERSGFAVCWLQELWANDIKLTGRLLDVLEQFDHVICPFYHTTEHLKQRISTPVTYMTWGVDTKLFCPYPSEPRRAIDVCAVGEVHPIMHERLLEFAETTGQYYQYGTIRGHHAMASHVAHRRNYADTLKRSRYFLSFLAKIVNTQQRGTQEEFGLRYLEGIAAGTVMLGSKVNNPSYDMYFDWPDAVIDIPFDAADIADVIAELDADPKRVAQIRRDNVVNALTRHDHLHRWEKVLEIAGLKPLPKMAQRQNQLIELAHLADHGTRRPKPLKKSVT